MRAPWLATVALILSACATVPEAGGAPDFTPIVTAPSANARHYADCIAQATAGGRYGHAYDEVHVVVFTCEGDTARAFYDALGPWSASIGSEISLGERTIRPTTVIERDLFAADYCERQREAYRCAISLRTGEFVRP